MAEENGKNGSNVFNFDAFKKAMDELNKQKAAQEEKKKQEQDTPPDDFTKMLEAFGELFKPPSQEEMNKAASQFADSLESAAKVVRAMQQPPSTEDDDEGDES
jgi:DNA replication protein DnaD